MAPPPNEITLLQVHQHLYAAVICDALDSLGYSDQSPRVPLRQLTSPTMLVGRCHTTLWADMYHPDPRPYELELKAVDSCCSDDVFIAAGGSMRSGIWGELLMSAVCNGGCVGVIVDGAVRDVAKICQLGFPVVARGSCLYDSKHRQRVIDRDVPVEIGGVLFSPGDLVVADEDGIVLVPQRVEAEVLARAWAKVHDENRVRKAIQGGMKAVEAFATFGVL
jgi:regulator of RNase E activity RraA